MAPPTKQRARRWVRSAPRRSRAPAGALPLSLVLLAACGGERSAPEGPPARNVLLVVLDTTRADRLGCYGGPPGITPYLDRLAEEGTRFERAYAHAPWTLPSTASLLTSLHPEQHGAGGFVDLGGEGGPARTAFRPLDESMETVAEVFARAGWATGAVVNVDFLSESFGLAQGFEHVDARVPRSNQHGRSAARTTDAALEWLREQGGRSTFLLVHYFDPHAVYAPPAEFRARFADPRDRGSEDFVFGTREDMLRLRAGRLALEPDVIDRASKLYDGEIAYADREIGRLLAGLDELGRAASTLVVFTSDHGEEFLDHGGFEHGHTLYDELIRVPLLVRLPGAVEAGGVVEEPVRHIDVAPTMCRLAGLATPAVFAGRDLFEPGPRPALAHGNFWGPPRTSWLSGGYKLVIEPPAEEGGERRARLFHLETDPREERDLAAERPEVVERLRAEMGLHARWSRAEASGTPEMSLSPDEHERLEALGYLPAPPERQR